MNKLSAFASIGKGGEKLVGGLLKGRRCAERISKRTLPRTCVIHACRVVLLFSYVDFLCNFCSKLSFVGFFCTSLPFQINPEMSKYFCWRCNEQWGTIYYCFLFFDEDEEHYIYTRWFYTGIITTDLCDWALSTVANGLTRFLLSQPTSMIWI